jgi:acetyl-CoA C-acetyltransferase
MSEQREVVILSGVRTAIGDYGGSLKDIPPTELAARVVREAVSRAKVDPNDIGQCVFGNVLHGEPKDMYLSRVACVNGGLPHGTGALTLNRLCGSGLQAIVSASQYILLGDTDAAVAGGAESMSRAAYMNTTQRWGARMGDAKMFDAMVGALTDPFDAIHWGSPPRTSPPSAASRASSRTRLQSRATNAPPRRLPPATSRARSCRSSSRARKARHNSIPTSTCAPSRPSMAWPS